MIVPSPLAMAWYELNDLGNAKRIKDLAGGKLVWCEDHWRAYDGQRWSAEDGARLAQRLAHDMARHIPAEAEALAAEAEDVRKTDPGKAETYENRVGELYKHGVTSGNANKTTAALSQLKSEVPAMRDEFDTDPLAVNVANGTLRFVKNDDGTYAAQLRPHDPLDRLSKMIQTGWNPEAEAPEWQAHLETVLPDPEARHFFHRAMGYAFTGLTVEQVILMLQGRGGDGKSTTMDVVREVMGTYAQTAAVESFLSGAVRSGAEASPDMADLAGDTRLVCTSEPRIGAALDEGRIKQITGGQPIKARELHSDPFTYIPKFLLVLECNRKPRISGDDDGIWRRVLVIEFPHQFKGDSADKGVKARLLAEAEGVLRWLVEGAILWLTEGLEPPASIRETIEDYRRASNPFGEWFAERVDVKSPDERERAADLYASYKQFCEDNGVTDREVMTSTAFGRALGDKQLRKMKGSDGKVLRLGCRLRADHELALTSAAIAAQNPAGDASVPMDGLDGMPEDWD